MDSPRRCRIALVEHDAMIARPILATLREAGHVCRQFETGAGALREIDRDAFDLILIDRTLPDIASLDLMTGVRARLGYSLPVIGLASDAEGVVAALDEGVDDCLSRPVPPRLLLAQVNAAIRRAPPQAGRLEAVIGHLAFQSDRLTVRVGDGIVPLTAKEYALALLFCRKTGQILAREDILHTIWGDEIAPLTRTLDVHISRLRTKLELRPERGFTLSALYGHGYRLDYVPAGGAAGTADAPGTTPAARSDLSPRRSASPSAPRSMGRRRPAR